MRQAILLEPVDLAQLRRGVGLSLHLGTGETITLLFAARSTVPAIVGAAHRAAALNGNGARPVSPLKGRKLTGKALKAAQKAAAAARAAKAAKEAAHGR